MTKRVATARLFWSSAYDGYIWQEGMAADVAVLEADLAQWQQRLNGLASFAFQGRFGHLSLLKERRAYGSEGYWYAYRRQGKRTTKKYVGRTTDLTIARLERLAQALSASAALNDGSSLQADEGGKGHHEPPRAISLEKFQTPLLKSKLHPPRPRASLLIRERLLALLDKGLEQKLMLICAPAGFGKSTLVSTWLAARNEQLSPVAWVSLEDKDNDAIRFWHYLLAACQTLQEEIGAEALTLLRSMPHPPLTQNFLEVVLTTLLNDLTHLSKRSILVLEDYHLILSPDIQQGMYFLLEHLPANMHVILLTRSTPLLPLAKMRARNELAEVGMAQLRFTLEETRAFLTQTLHFSFEKESLDLLHRYTEGWATGLRLITLAWPSQEVLSVREMQQRLFKNASSLHHLLDYLVEEVLLVQSEILQTFLLQTSSLQRLNSSLCDAMTGRGDSAICLEQLERSHLFLYQLEGDGQWYRYHTLFAEVMQQEARRRLGEESLRQLASRASDWYERHNMLPDAVEAAFNAQDVGRAVKLMIQIIEARHLLQLQELHLFLRWLGQLPEAIMRDEPLLSKAYAMVLAFSSAQRTLAFKPLLEKYLQMAESKLRERGEYQELGETLALHALLSAHINDEARAIEMAGQALPLLPEREWIWRGIALGMLGMDALLAGRVADARLPNEYLEGAAEVEVDEYGKRGSLLLQGYFAHGTGQLHQAQTLLRQVFDQAGEDLSDKGMALIGLANLSYEWNQIAVAESDAEEAYMISQERQQEQLQAQASIILARVRYAQGKFLQAQEILHEAAVRLMRPRWRREIEMWLAWLAYLSADIPTVRRWLAACQSIYQEEELTDYIREREALLTARLLIKEKNGTDALGLLERWLVAAQNQERLRSEIEIILLMARAYESQGQMPEARLALLKGISLAEPEGYLRLFLDEEEGWVSLLKTSLPSINEQAQLIFVRRLLQSIGKQQAASADELLFVEALSPQERKVLRLLVAGRSNPEIANELVVSLNTIKTQVKHIYRKLQVRNRLEASEMARRWHLL
ncbi:hypothetical protein EPA93_14060 [Ktedonosporobacter rubrisoli]|uniref:HTH luxR-type domain-containing protein n=1 Tax=Ktedonosporobacter rubrisoli TaxID=2509675 RepID=A0A4P6JP01_KTERU|nr:LuxR C-terminal-related transcriptional regulator [Ktedonosporobacter rubrisoli]QBD77067.1 hypothetical protein EPA93_14060 [Ktedonosporobacter rubrisoli]